MSKKKTDVQISEEDIKDDIKIFPTTDDQLKFLGEIFSNESSRKILTLLLEKKLTVMEISRESKISPNLIIHHLKKMVNLRIVVIVRESTSSRGRPLRFYRAKPAIVILSEEASRRANKSKSLKKILGRITRFGSIGLAGIVTWVLANPSQSVLDSAYKYPRPTMPQYMMPIEPQIQSSEFLFAVIVTASVVVAGLLINYAIKRIRK